jgi:hypothetical protein
MRDLDGTGALPSNVSAGQVTARARGGAGGGT